MGKELDEVAGRFSKETNLPFSEEVHWCTRGELTGQMTRPYRHIGAVALGANFAEL